MWIGSWFSAGADLGEVFPVPISDQLNAEYKPAIEAIYHSPKITISQIHGKAAGIGAGFAMATDLTIMAEDAAYYLAFAAIGLVPDGGITWHLTRALGRKRASEMILEGKAIDAKTSLAAGLANRVVSASELEDAALSWAQDLSKVAPIAAREAKAVIGKMDGVGLSDAISLEAEAQNICQVTQDHARAVDGFKSKTKVEFQGN